MKRMKKMKSTTDLWDEMLETDTVEEFIKNNRESINFKGAPELMKYYIKTKKLKNKKVFEEANISRSYGNEILAGRKNPSRDVLIQLCFGLHLNLDETQHFLKVCGKKELYTKSRRDLYTIYAFKDKKSLVELNIELEKKGVKIFGSEN